MKSGIIIVIMSCFTMLSAQSYCAGDQINANDLNTDYRYARENIYNIIERGQEAIEDLLQDARDSGNARMFEVVGQLIKTVGEQNQNLINVHKQVKDITQDTKAVPSNVTNALFVGSTAELQKMLKDKKE